MKYIVLPLAIFLSGCVTPVKHAFPVPPPMIVERCLDLNKIPDDEEQLTEFVKAVIRNYNMYHECAAKHDLLTRWIDEQIKIHDAVFNKGD